MWPFTNLCYAVLACPVCWKVLRGENLHSIIFRDLPHGRKVLVIKLSQFKNYKVFPWKVCSIQQLHSSTTNGQCYYHQCLFSSTLIKFFFYSWSLLIPSQRQRRNHGTRITSAAGDVMKSSMENHILKKTSKSIVPTAMMNTLPICAMHATNQYPLVSLWLRKTTSIGMETVTVAPAVTRNWWGKWCLLKALRWCVNHVWPVEKWCLVLPAMVASNQPINIHITTMNFGIENVSIVSCVVFHWLKSLSWSTRVIHSAGSAMIYNFPQDAQPVISRSILKGWNTKTERTTMHVSSAQVVKSSWEENPSSSTIINPSVKNATLKGLLSFVSCVTKALWASVPVMLTKTTTPTASVVATATKWLPPPHSMRTTTAKSCVLIVLISSYSI